MPIEVRDGDQLEKHVKTSGTGTSGDPFVVHHNVDAVVPGTGATNLGKAIDTATGATDTGVLSLGTRDDALSALTPIEGDNVPMRLDANGALHSNMSYKLDATNDQVCDGSGVVLRPTITTSATPDYTAGDVISGIITLSSVMFASGRSAVLRSVTMKDDSNQGPGVSLLFFRATPSGGTYTDNAQLVWGAGDLANLVGVVRIATTDWYSPAASVAKALISVGDIGIEMGSATSDLYLLIIADETINLASTSDLSAEIAFERR